MRLYNKDNNMILVKYLEFILEGVINCYFHLFFAQALNSQAKIYALILYILEVPQFYSQGMTSNKVLSTILKIH